jgi:hypothetical protein
MAAHGTPSATAIFQVSVGAVRSKNIKGKSPADLLVLPESDHYAALRCTSEAPLDFSALKLDIYVAPSSFEWTMVFTHEHPYGPYLARADWR